MTSANVNNDRFYSIDFIRTLCCLLVVLLHVVSGWRDDPIGGTSYKTGNIWDIVFYHYIVCLLVRWCVPTFFMKSGYLFTKKEVDIYKQIKHIALPLAFWGTVYGFIEIVVTSRTVTIMTVLQAVMNTLQEKSWSPLWFLYSIIGCYIFSPTICGFVRTSSQENVKKILLSEIVIFSFIPSINLLTGSELTTFGLSNAAAAILWFSIGAYLSKYKMKSLIYPKIAVMGGYWS